ncbi:DUF4012 domain-containing protein [Pseudofrankia sp. BMG5.36]|uniref:DUF4012 domain-containing protein n=1 Tax=Pseudofrankia sp. BMG5.36 TaxID=1834512 RepID=UPI000A662C33|nr:DUF4012 domain-containing protein [Pseudofrankia sp. BMG5.36]
MTADEERAAPGTSAPTADEGAVAGEGVVAGEVTVPAQVSRADVTSRRGSSQARKVSSEPTATRAGAPGVPQAVPTESAAIEATTPVGTDDATASVPENAAVNPVPGPEPAAGTEPAGGTEAARAEGAGAEEGAGESGRRGGVPLAVVGRVARWPRRFVRRPSRRALLVGACVLGPVLALVGWIGVRGLLAHSELNGARADITRLQQRLLAGDVPAPADLAAEIRRISDRTHSAAGLTGDPVWSAATHLPGVGCSLRSAHSLTVAVDGVAGGGLPAIAQAADTLNPASLRSGLTINLAALARGKEPVAAAAVAVERFRGALAAVPDCGWLGRRLGLAPARATAASQATRLAGSLAGLKLATEIGPPMLGAGGETRHYLLIVQNPAESRANGGIIGGFGVLTARNGELSLDDISGNGKLPQLPPDSKPRADPRLPADLAARYGPYQPTDIWANANLTPDYPTAGRFYSDLYKRTTGIDVDGTVSIDPTALSYLLAATTPAVMPDGRVIKASDLVRLVESDAYALISDTNERDQFFADVGKSVYRAVTSGVGSTPKLLDALGRAAGEGRLLVSTNHADEQSILSTTPLGGALPSAPGPFLAVVTQNAAASKLDYWMRRAVGYRMDPAPGGGGVATIAVQLLNDAPDGLPEYVRYRLDLGGPGGNQDAQNQVWLSVYTGVGSRLIGATLDGKQAVLTNETERGHSIVSVFLPLDRGRPRTLLLQVWEPVAGPALTVRTQPLVTPAALAVVGLPVHAPWSLTVGK